MKRLATALLLLTAVPALANDSTATIGAGGLVLEKSDSIYMVSENLYVSVDKIRVDYRFRNRRLAAAPVVVAFPMPERRLSDEYGGDVAYPSGFRAIVDGKPVKVTLERKALVDGKDQSELLTELRIPIAPESINEATKVMDALPPPQRRELIRLGLAGEEQWDDDGKGMKKHLIPLWSVQDKYWWRQVFPVGRDLSIRHEYVPGAGGSVESAIAFPDLRQSSDRAAIIARYCIDDAFLAAVDARRGKGNDGPGMPERTIDYILTTGGNWAGPIGDFRLLVDKGKPTNLVSFCGNGVRKISPTQFEMRQRNFVPKSDLHILIIEPRR